MISERENYRTQYKYNMCVHENKIHQQPAQQIAFIIIDNYYINVFKEQKIKIKLNIHV